MTVMDIELQRPQERSAQIGRAALEAPLRAAMEKGVFSHGWIIAGPQGAGKATLAYRIARGVLDPSALQREDSFDVSPDARVFHLIAAGAHPDLFVAARIWDEKKAKHQAEITVETIRKLTGFLNRTASGGGWRVAIIDTADDMNRNAANALLKALEEPPAKTLLMLLSASPGRLLPTLRSRCRRIDLPPLDDEAVRGLLVNEGVEAGAIDALVGAARGRPGYALRLAAEDGVEAIRLAERFFSAAAKDDDISKYASALAGKGADSRWEIFKAALIEGLSEAARKAARGEAAPASPSALLAAWETAGQLIARGEGLNLDRGQLIFALAHDIRAALKAEAA